MDAPAPTPPPEPPGGSALSRAVRAFLAIEASGGLLLVGAALVAVVWASSPWRHGYASFVDAALTGTVGGHHLHVTVHHAVNDGLMAVFFLVIGMELEREWFCGELRDRRAALLPAVAALGGMVVPALLYLAVDRGSATSHGWGIPMATDIAFALGVVALLGRRVPAPLRVFLLTLAIVDDLGAILVIALVYSQGVRPLWLGAAVLGVAAMGGLRAARVRSAPVYVALGIAIWFATLQSGVHATIAGVVVGLVAPTLPDDALGWFEGALHPWTSYVIVPVFALVNAGVSLADGFGGDGVRLTVAVLVGLVVGKTVGVAGASWLVVRAGWSSLPDGVRWSQVVGVGALAGIGFTMSLFVTDLAFGGPSAAAYADHAKAAVLSASVVAAVCGSLVLALTARGRRGPEPSGVAGG